MKSANWTAHDCHRSDDRRPRHNHRGKLLEHWGWLQLYYHMVRSYMYGLSGSIHLQVAGWCCLSTYFKYLVVERRLSSAYST